MAKIMFKKNQNIHLINYLAKEAVNKLQCNISGICSYSAELITERLLKEKLSDFYVIEGYVRVPGWTGRTTHSWIELYDGSIVDPVFEQFPEGTKRLSSQKKYSPKQYMKLLESHTNIKSDVEKYVNDLSSSLKEFFVQMSEATPKKDKPGDKKDKPGGDKKDAKSGIVDTPPDTEIPKDKPFGNLAAKTGGGGAGAPPGADIFGAEEPFGAPEGGKPEPEKPEDEKASIANYSQKLKSSKIIKYQKIEPEPGYKFEPDDKFYSENYVGKTKNGSMLLAIPKFETDDKEKSLAFIKNLVIPKIDNVIKTALSQKKRIVLMGYHGIPYINGKYSSDEQGMIAQYFNKKYKGGYIVFDTWSPQEYYAFKSNDELWQQVKQRTEAKNLEIKSALYLYLLTTINGRKFADKLKTPNVLKTLQSWGLTEDDVVKFTSEGLSKIAAIIYPELADNPETLASFIIKTYMQLLRINMMQKLLKYEKEGKLVIILSDEHTAWALKPSFDKADEFLKKPKPQPKEKPAGSEETPHPAPETGKEQPPEKKQ